MKKLTLPIIGLFFVLGVGVAQSNYAVYDPHDVKQLKKFLQEDAVSYWGEKITNSTILLGTEIVDWNYLNWLHDLNERPNYNAPTKKVLEWTDEPVKRLKRIDLDNLNHKKYGLFLSGYLDLEDCKALEFVVCYDERLTSVNLKGCEKLQWVSLHSNRIEIANFEGCGNIQSLYINNNHLLASNLNVPHLPAIVFDFKEQEVLKPDYSIEWWEETLCLKIDLTAEMKSMNCMSRMKNTFWRCIIQDDESIRPINILNTGEVYYALEDIQNLVDGRIALRIQYKEELSPDEYKIWGEVFFTSTVTSNMGRITIETEPELSDAQAFVYWFQNDNYVLTDELILAKDSRSKRLPEGKYIIGVNAPGFLFAYYSAKDYVTFWDGADTIQLSSNGQYITVKLQEKRVLTDNKITISGILEEDITTISMLKASARVLQKSTVKLHSSTSPTVQKTAEDNWILVATTQTDDNGYYSFTNLPQGYYRITVEIPGYEMVEPIFLEANSEGAIYGNQNFLVSEENKTITPNVEKQIISGYLSHEEIQLSVYPNPVTDVVHIDGLEGAYTLKIITMTGQIVTSISGSSPELSLYPVNLPSGLYLLRIESQGRARTVKLIKN